MNFDDRFIKPAYDSGCFADIPPTLSFLLTGNGVPRLPLDMTGQAGQYDAIVFFFIDAFGWRCFEKFADAPFLRHFIQQGKVSRITSQFPSTTAAHVTTIHTGLPVGTSGVYEWQYYEPQLDAIIAPLLHAYAGTPDRETLPPDADPTKLYPGHSIYQDWAQSGVDAFVFQHRDYIASSFSRMVFQGAATNPYRTWPEALANLASLATGRRSRRPAYYFLYLADVDTISHQYGPDSPQAEAEIEAFLAMMERLVWQKLSGKLGNALLILSADHGQVNVDPATTIYLNLDPALAPVLQWLRTDHLGRWLVPAGSPRDMFLYVKDARLDEAHALLVEHLAGRAAVYRTRDLINDGFFGPDPVSAAFLGRVGNLVILPYENESIWWYEKGKFEQRSFGHHGGLTPQEMEIPLLVTSL